MVLVSPPLAASCVTQLSLLCAFVSCRSISARSEAGHNLKNYSIGFHVHPVAHCGHNTDSLSIPYVLGSPLDDSTKETIQTLLGDVAGSQHLRSPRTR